MTPAGQFILHVTTAGERWDLLAWRYYGDPTDYSPIIMANPNVAIEPVFDAGVSIAIPLQQKSSVITANLPPWKLSNGDWLMAASASYIVRAPQWILTYSGVNITADVSAMVLAISYVDRLDGASGDLELELEDSTKLWQGPWYPAIGDIVSLQIGYSGEPLLDCGEFQIDELELDGPPDVMRLRCLGVVHHERDAHGKHGGVREYRHRGNSRANRREVWTHPGDGFIRVRERRRVCAGHSAASDGSGISETTRARAQL